MLILRPTDRVPCTIGQVKLWVSPLTWEDKNKALAMGKSNQTQMAVETLRNSIKKVEFLVEAKLSDGSVVKAEYDDDGKLTYESLELVITAGGNAAFSLLSAALLTSSLNESMEGVEVDFGNVEDTKKKN